MHTLTRKLLDHGIVARCWALGLCLAAAVATAQDAAAPAPTQPAAPVARHVVRHRSAALALDDRVQLMAKELDLDATQQAELKGILLNQRAQVLEVWNNSSVPAALRISATQAISEQTGDRIRAMLTDAQREKYIKSRPHDTPVGAPGSDLQKWMTATQGH